MTCEIKHILSTAPYYAEQCIYYPCVYNFLFRKLSHIKDNKIDNYLKKNITNNKSVYELETPQKGTASYSKTI